MGAEKLPRFGTSRGTPSRSRKIGEHSRGDSAEGVNRVEATADQGTGGKGCDGDKRSLSKAAKLLEEDKKKVGSIRSFLLNFLEERDCSVKKRLVRCQAQILHR